MTVKQGRRHDGTSEKGFPSYEVGYGRPPRSHRFQPGRSGNPKGRPKGAKSEATILAALLNRKLEIREGGRTRRVTVLEGVLLRIAEDALKGNTKAAAFLLSRHAAAELGEVQPLDEMSKDDRAIVDEYLKRVTSEGQEKK